MIFRWIYFQVYTLCFRNYPSTTEGPNELFGCPGHHPDWMYLGGEDCYYIETTNNFTWSEARDECLSRGGMLASIHSEEEEKILHPHFRHSKTGIFFGLNSLSTGDYYSWVDGSRVDYIHWAENEPNDKNEKCGEILVPEMTWNDVSCNVKRGFICKTKKTTPNNTENGSWNSDKGEDTTGVSNVTASKPQVSEKEGETNNDFILPTVTESEPHVSGKEGETNHAIPKLSITITGFHDSHIRKEKKTTPGFISSLAIAGTGIIVIATMTLLGIFAYSHRQKIKEKAKNFTAVFFIFRAKHKPQDIENLLEIRKEVSENIYVNT